MRVICGWRRVPPSAKGAVLAIGNFDGVHRGHRAVIGRAMELARDEGRPAGVLVFEPHPREFFDNGNPFFRLTPLPLKLALLADLGLDQAFVIEFGPQLASMSAEVFVTDVLVQGLGVAGTVVGHDFAFGKGRAGTTSVLTAFGAEHGFKVDIMPAVRQSGTIFSSSRIRELLARGEVDKAAVELGYRWRARGKVGLSKQRGGSLGLPTIVVPLAAGQSVGRGLYAVQVRCGGGQFDALGQVGSHPAFGRDVPILEAHVFDDVGNLWGEEVEVEFAVKVRDSATFANSKALPMQIAADCAVARSALASLRLTDSMRPPPPEWAFLSHATDFPPI